MKTIQKTVVVSFDLDSVLYPFLDQIGDFIDQELVFDTWDLGLGRDRMKLELRKFSAAGGFKTGKPLVDPARIKKLQELGLTVIYVTARREEERADTQQWLDENGFDGQLIMSNWKGIPTTMFDQKDHVFFGLDDKPSNVDDMVAAGMNGFLADYPFSKQYQADNPFVPVVRDATQFCDIMEGSVLGVSW
jgi:hypothetical protein